MATSLRQLADTGRRLLVLGAVVFLGVAYAQDARATIVDFEGYAVGQVLLNQPELRPVEFPHGVLVNGCPAPGACTTAYSGSTVAVAQLVNEFTRAPFVAQFVTPQEVVSLYAKVADSQPARDYLVTLNGYLGSSPAGGVSATLGPSPGVPGGWVKLTVGTLAPGGRVDRVVLTGASGFLLVDDLEFRGGEPPPPAPSDSVPPTVAILEPPPGTTTTSRSLTVRVRATDDQELRTVNGDVVHDETGTSTPYSICGDPGHTAPCPATFIEESTFPSVSLPELFGTYTIRATACDAAGNCATATRTFTLSAGAAVRLERMEVNQAVQGLGTTPLPPAGGVEDVRTGVPLVAGKPLVVRVYAFGQTGPVPSYTASLRVRAHRGDGSVFVRTISPNAGSPSASLPAWPGSSPAALDPVLLGMRMNPASTLNYVIPLAADVRLLELRVLPPTGSGTGSVRVPLQAPVRLGLNIVEITGPAVLDMPLPPSPENLIIPYLRAAYPVAEVRVLSRSRMVAHGYSYGGPRRGDCSAIFGDLWMTYGGDDAPVGAAFTSDPHVITTIGIIPAGSADCNGQWSSSPWRIAFGDAYPRVGGTVITQPFGDTAAHEIVHSLGFEHAGNFHGEEDGGGAEAWPYQHGSMGAHNFGAVALPTAAAGAAEFGQWQLTVIDPCLGFLAAGRFSGGLHTGCPAVGAPISPGGTFMDTQLVHDVMSYGSSTTGFPTTLPTSRGRWVSDITYRRIYEAIRLGVPAARRPAGADNPARRVEAFLILASIGEDGSATLEAPLFRKPVPASMLDDGTSGAYVLELRNEAGAVLRRHAFDLKEVLDGPRPESVIREAVPYVPGVGRVVLTKAGATIAEWIASAHAPRVRLITPNGGEQLRGGVQTIRWQATDRDGDPVWSLVQYSPDGGKRWQGVAIVDPGSPKTAELRVGSLIPGKRAIVRITVSDGVLTATDRSDRPFALGQPGHRP
jgi:hypothetical protein